MVVRREVTVVLPARFLPRWLWPRSCAPDDAGARRRSRCQPAVTTPTDPATATDPNAEQPDDMAAGLAPLLEAVDETRALRLDADKEVRRGQPEDRSRRSRREFPEGRSRRRPRVGRRLRPRRLPVGPQRTGVLAGLLDSGSPTDLMRRVDDARAGRDQQGHRVRPAQQVLLKAQRTAARPPQHATARPTPCRRLRGGEAAALAEVTDYTGKWADQLAADAGGATDQDHANSIAAQAWSDWLARPEADGAPTVTVAMVRSGKDASRRVFVQAAAPGVAFWSDSLARPARPRPRSAPAARRSLLLPDQTVQMITYGVSRLGSALPVARTPTTPWTARRWSIEPGPPGRHWFCRHRRTAQPVRGRTRRRHAHRPRRPHPTGRRRSPPIPATA